MSRKITKKSRKLWKRVLRTAVYAVTAEKLSCCRTVWARDPLNDSQTVVDGTLPMWPYIKNIKYTFVQLLSTCNKNWMLLNCMPSMALKLWLNIALIKLDLCRLTFSSFSGNLRTKTNIPAYHSMNRMLQKHLSKWNNIHVGSTHTQHMPHWLEGGLGMYLRWVVWLRGIAVVAGVGWGLKAIKQ